MIKIVIIDFDDTLCLTEEACFKLENDIAGQMRLPPMTRKTHQKNWGAPLREAISDRLPGVDAEKFMELIEIEVERYVHNGHLDTISKENIQTLDKLKGAGKKLALLTSRSHGEVRHLLHESHPISQRIEKIYHQGNSEHRKPDPRVFDQVLSHFEAQPAACVYIGDAVTDAMAAKGAGMQFIAVMESGLRSREDFEGWNVDFYADKFPDILQYILAP